MKLVSLTVANFRSITATRRIPIAQLTTLVGPNNEGKSNILRAFVIGMRYIISKDRTFMRRVRPPFAGIIRRTNVSYRRRLFNEDVYSWETDFPIKLQSKNSTTGSTITLEFDLTSDEINELNQQIGSKLNGTLPVSIEFLQTKEVITIAKQGPSQKGLSAKASKIADFIADKIEIQYIPAVRTAQSTQETVSELVQRELSKIEVDEKYKQALADIASLQEPILTSLSDNITKTMKEFLPNIINAKIVIQEQDRSYALRGISEIMLNDGAETSLDFKGDGVQSLAAIALMRHASQSRHEGKEVLIALEEPESHLHPSAIRQLRNVLSELSARHQILVSTHNPIFANRTDIHQNIIVSKNRAYRAKSNKGSP